MSSCYVEAVIASKGPSENINSGMFFVTCIGLGENITLHLNCETGPSEILVLARVPLKLAVRRVK